MEKKLWTMLLVVVLITALLVGCDGQESEPATGAEEIGVTVNDGDLQDGKYLVKSPVEHGNFSMATMEVTNGEISSFAYSEIMCTTGEEKNEENYSDFVQVLPIIEDLNKQFNEKKDLNEMDFDAMTGATGTVETFKELVNELLKKAKAGDTYTPIYKDGEYTAQADEDSRGWLGEVKVVIKEGQIVGVDYYEFAVEDLQSSKAVLDDFGEPVLDDAGNPETELVEVKAGERKSNDNYNYPEMFDVIAEIQKLVIDNNGTENLEVDSITGATGSRDTMIELIEKVLEEAK